MQSTASYSNRFSNKSSNPAQDVTNESLARGWEKRTVQEALDELARELGVRERIYCKWVLDGKHTLSDAQDRYQRMILAATLLDAICKNEDLCKQVSCLIATQDANKDQSKPF